MFTYKKNRTKLPLNSINCPFFNLENEQILNQCPVSAKHYWESRENKRSNYTQGLEKIQNKIT